MSQFDELINNLQTMEYAEKKQFLEYLVRIAERASHQLTQADKEALLSYAYEEVDRMLQAIPNAATYKEKDIIFECEDFLLGIVMHLSGSPTNLPQDRL